MRSRRVAIAVALSIGLLASACGGDDRSMSSDATTGVVDTIAPVVTEAPGTTAAVDTTAAPSPSCTPPAGRVPLEATDVGNDRDWDIVSFDGTVIRAHWFPVGGGSAEAPAPTVLMGPGWGSAGDVNVDSPGFLGAISIATLRDNGYNVLTWDPRGFGESTGTAQVDSPQFEGRDIQQLIDFVGARPEALLDADGDPRMGMVGASYGGGAQFIAAGTDCRVDAIVPIIAWNSLGTSLFKGDVPKIGWANLLMVAAQAGGGELDPTVTQASASANATGTFTEADAQWFLDRGPGELVGDITVPTLIIQGTVDTLFTLDEAVANYRLLREAGTEVSMLWYCGGHGVCLTDPGEPALIDESAIAWLDRYVQGDTSAAAVPGFGTLDQFGQLHIGDEYPSADGAPITASGTGTLELVADGGAGPATPT
ncbi:MAG: CocE/NonD family hydrolase, partial [Actinomycetota bacterium]